MKKLLLIIFMIATAIPAYTQKEVFVRVFRLNGTKMIKGYVTAVTDSSLTLKIKRATTLLLAVKDIGSIKTKHSAGHNILVGAIVGGVPMAVLGAISSGGQSSNTFVILHYNAAEGALLGLIGGLPVGAVIGAITILFKNSTTFIINGDPIHWKKFQHYLGASHSE